VITENVFAGALRLVAKVMADGIAAHGEDGWMRHPIEYSCYSLKGI